MSTAKFALLGHPLAHSMSPFLHQRLFAAAGVQVSYELLDAAPEELPAAVERLREFDGFNITIHTSNRSCPISTRSTEQLPFLAPSIR